MTDERTPELDEDTTPESPPSDPVPENPDADARDDEVKP